MKRSAAGGLGVVLLLIAGLLYWRCGARGGAPDPAGGASSASGASPASASGTTAPARPRVDPAKLSRGSLAGTITDDKKAPVPRARVCAEGSSSELPGELLRDPICATADEAGRYQLPNLLPARYAVSASARPFRPEAYHPGGDRHRTRFPLAAGEHRTGIDIVLRPGGVEITGTVSDLTGGPIAGAKVRAGNDWQRVGGAVHGETDEHGKFSLWVGPGSIQIAASAEGYTGDEEWGRAPGTFELLLTPESSLAGTVVDAATSAPVAGARVNLSTTNEWGWDNEGGSAFADDKGQFRIPRVPPGRHVVAARTDRGYGQTEGSTLVGLGQHVDGVIVKLFPAVRLEGKIVVSTTKAPCEDGWASLTDAARSSRTLFLRPGDGGALSADGVRAGIYNVSISCNGYRDHEHYDPVVVAGKDVTGLVWEVDPGATIRGKVLAKSGDPVDGALVRARKVGGEGREKRSFNNFDTSAADGQYELPGLRPGSYTLEVETDRGVAPEDGYKVEVAAGATVAKDLVIDDGGTIRGTVVDGEGKAVPGVEVVASLGNNFSWRPGGSPKSDGTGAFAIEGLRPGDYRVTAQKGLFDELRKPGTTDDAKQGERVTVRANQTSTVRLVIEAQTGTIRGTVADAEGKPVGDAFISAARESDAAGARPSNVTETRWSWDEKPALTGVDGAFTVSKLSPGKYTLRAYRKGGGEAIAEHVPVGGTAKLQIKLTSSLDGTARRAGSSIEDLTVSVREPQSGLYRREQFYRTSGHYTVRDLPKGHFVITVEAEGGQKQIETDLAEGEAKTGLDVELEALVDVTGRIVEYGTAKPVAGIRMTASLAKGSSGMILFRAGDDADREHISDDSGRFKIKHAPAGALVLRGMSKDFQASEYGFVSTVRTVDPAHPDVGDIQILKRRTKPNEPVGELGVNFAEQPPDTPPEQREFKVSYIDPAGPAAKTELKVGDLITSIDGIDITGGNAMNAWLLMRAPPGTRLALGLKRGATVTVVLAAP